MKPLDLLPDSLIGDALNVLWCIRELNGGPGKFGYQFLAAGFALRNLGWLDVELVPDGFTATAVRAAPRARGAR